MRHPIRLTARRLAPIALSLALAACSDPSGSATGPLPDLGVDDLGGDTAKGDVPEPEDDADATPEPDALDDATDVLDDATEPDALEDVEPPPDVPVDPDVAEDVPTDTAPPIPEPDVVVDFTLCSPPGGDRNIYDLQNPGCPDHITPAPIGSNGVEVVVKDVIVTARFGDTFFVQEPEGGPYSGIAVFSHGDFTGDLVPGTVVDVEGSYSEYFDNSQIYLTKWTVKDQGPAPAPYPIAHPSHVATAGPVAELFEGVLVQVTDVKTTHTQPDCPHDYGEFEVTGGLRVDDVAVKFPARLGDHFASITGPLHYTFGNHKLEPRTDDDLVVLVKGSEGALSKCIKAQCVVGMDVLGTHQLVVNEVMPDPFGEDTMQEWIELYNPGNDPVSLDGWSVRDCGSQKVTLIGAGAVVPAKGYFVLGAASNSTLNGGVPVDYAYGQAFYLPNTIGSVLLYNAQGQFVDQMRYSAFDEPKVFKLGASLERISHTNNGAELSSWKTATKTFGPTENKGTPGAKNSATN